MVTLRSGTKSEKKFNVSVEKNGMDRRVHRRHDLEQQGIAVTRWDGRHRVSKEFGTIVDLSAGGLRIRTNQKNVRADNQIRLRLELPAYAGISPFVNTHSSDIEPTREWVGWMTVSRVQAVDDEFVEVAGRLEDMDEMDRGMLGLYLSTQPLAA